MDAREEMLAAVIEVAGWKWDDRPGIGGLSTWEAFIAHEVHAAGYRKMPDREAITKAIESNSFMGAGEEVGEDELFLLADDAIDAILALVEGNK